MKGHSITFKDILAASIVLIIMAYFFWISRHCENIQENHNIAEIKTALIAVLMTVATFYFGTSLSSTKKDETIKEMLHQSKIEKKADTVDSNNPPEGN